MGIDHPETARKIGQTCQQRRGADVTAALAWRKDGTGWLLLNGRRRLGRVTPDTKHPGMWRCVLAGGRLSDMANLSWARSATLDAATRELEWEVSQSAAIAPPKCPVNEGVFCASAPPMRSWRCCLRHPSGGSGPTDLTLQFGCPVMALRKALSRDARGNASSPLGVALDLVFSSNSGMSPASSTAMDTDSASAATAWPSNQTGIARERAPQ